MATFVVVTLGPCSLFLLYALYRFWCEARQPARKRTPRSRPVRNLNGSALWLGEGREPKSERAKTSDVVMFPARSKQSRAPMDFEREAVSRG
jgi:hypothetical protein